MGAVYVYRFNEGEGDGGDGWKLLFDKPLHATSKDPGARFGAAVSNIGDVDGDGKEDFAVAAPREEPGGAVYIYRGYRKWMKEGTHYPCTLTDPTFG